jgi:hypothetical protein
MVRTIVVPNASGDAGWTLRPAPSEVWRCAAVKFNLATSAVAGNRTCVVSLNDGTGITFATAVAPGTQAPSLTFGYTFALGLQAVENATAVTKTAALPELVCAPQCSVTVSVNNGDTGDVLSVTRVSIETWPYDPAMYDEP